MTLNDFYTELDTLTLAAPNLEAVRLTAALRGITVDRALIEQARDWCTALDEAIERSAQEAAMAIGNAEDVATTAEQRHAWFAEAHDHLTEVNRLAQLRTVAAQMVADAENNRLDGRDVRTVVLPAPQ